jgi:TetR/AcrR family transcriptional regulator, regulator of mycofactocin system
MVWGEFEQVLARLRAHLYASSPDEPLMDALRRAVVASNSYPAGDLPELRIRMTLITSVPALQAHSMLRYAEWRDVVAEFVAERLGDEPSGLAPQVIAHTALGTAMAVFVCWVRSGEGDLEENLERGFELLGAGFAGAGQRRKPHSRRPAGRARRT